MDTKQSQDFAVKQLDRVLGFFARVDAKASLCFAIDTGLLATMALNLKAGDFMAWYTGLPIAAFAVLVAVSLWFVYRCHFPQLDGGQSSLIYFREIAKRTEANYVQAALSQTDEDYTKDVLGQIWRNSEILKIKYDSIKVAFIATGVALLPWLIFLTEAAFWHSPGLVLK
jgi:hypothetical protein